MNYRKVGHFMGGGREKYEEEGGGWGTEGGKGVES